MLKALGLDYLMDTTPEKDEYRATPEVVLPMDLAKEYVQQALSQEEEKAIQEDLHKVYAPGGVAVSPEVNNATMAITPEEEDETKPDDSPTSDDLDEIEAGIFEEDRKLEESGCPCSELDEVVALIEESAKLEMELAKAKAREEVWEKAFRLGVSLACAAAVTKM